MISGPLADAWIDWKRHPISDLDYRNQALSEFNNSGALVLRGFFSAEFISRVVAESVARQGEAFYANSTHNVYLTPQDPQFSDDHAFNRQLVSSKGLIADDQISVDSPLRDVYEDDRFRAFLCALLGVEAVYPYADRFSSINVHYAPRGREPGRRGIGSRPRRPPGGGRAAQAPLHAARQRARRRRTPSGSSPVRRRSWAP